MNLLVLSLLGISLAQTDLHQLISREAAVLQSAYRPALGDWKGSGWWNEAHNIEALVHLSRDVGIRDYDWAVKRSYRRLMLFPPFGFINFVYDDEAWYALTYLQAGVHYGNSRWIRRARVLHKHIVKNAWDETCGGGIFWKPWERYKNATNNGVSALLSARLAYDLQGKGPGNNREETRLFALGWAKRILNWFETSGMVDEMTGLIADGLDQKCQNNHGPDWTYNQGIFIGAYATLAQLETDPQEKQRLLSRAKLFARGSLDYQTQDGVLVERNCRDALPPVPVACKPDGTSFKGILMENLVHLYEALPVQDPFRTRLAEFFRLQVLAIQIAPRNAQGFIGLNWSGSSVVADPTTQTSALEALIAAYRTRVFARE